jgi:hypothetical protein
MAPMDISIGQELVGDNGGSSPEIRWYYTQWRDSGGGWHYQGAASATKSENPPYAQWIVAPPSTDYPGGIWASSCC